MSDIEPRQSQQIRTKDGRAQWERPTLHRLAANDAEQTRSMNSDGVNPGGHPVPGVS